MVFVCSIRSAVVSLRHERKIESIFGEGVPLDGGEFYGRYFAAEGIPVFVVLEVKHIFEEGLGEDLSRLRPEDDLVNYFWQADDFADVEALQKCEEEFGIKLTQADANRMSTFRSIAYIIWEKIRQKSV